MNKFIKLYEEASKYAYEKLEPEYYNTPIFESIVAGRFAELIVIECVDVAFSKGDNVDYLIKHFGVDDKNTRQTDNDLNDVWI